MPRAATATRDADVLTAAIEQALEDTDEDTRTVYEWQQYQKSLGQIEYDPHTNSRVVFVPTVQGHMGLDGKMKRPIGYTAEVHAVEVNDIGVAARDGKDFWHNERGWILHGVKCASDPTMRVERVKPPRPSIVDAVRDQSLSSDAKDGE